ncbi:MAG: protocatechuate 3,4-dioxygenase subunit alpha [Hyphomicrobiales bacterium]|nr:protocatechuate 3,4-dioxygenase subunit alpha [Hyphomicrobiales bacterium]MBV9052452.1 protocatechuate 3,4-dioxygenase subunit alpha [Hyphomicrobiales bacterium]MBV9976309.1 protocatechuate 3,4-dioxygenase subunit alpha [Hyphomicrobiales bacterium]
MPIESGWATVGPFFHAVLPWKDGGVMAGPETKGEPITILGRVLDAEENPINDALIELWQANAGGKYNHPEDTQSGEIDPSFQGFGRVAADAEGSFTVKTIKPGPVRGLGNSWQAPHIQISVFARGVLKRLVTRLYFEGGPGNEHDPVLALIEDEERRETLMAKPDPKESGRWHFTLRLGGPRETVFFDV